MRPFVGYDRSDHPATLTQAHPMMSKPLAAMLVSATLILLAGCTGGGTTNSSGGSSAGTTTGGGTTGGTTTPPPTPVWTVFVYGNGDSSLSNSLMTDLTKMRAASLNQTVNIIVAADFDASQVEPGTSTHYPTGTNWYRITGGSQMTTIKTDPEQNFDDPATLTAAVTYAFKTYPAEHRAIVLWDHGGAWLGGFGSDTQDGSQAPNPMTIDQVATAVQTGLTNAGVTGTRPLDILGFDCCEMAGAETAFAMRNLSKTFIGCAELDYGSGWNYTSTFSTFAASGTSATPVAMAGTEVDQWELLHANASASDQLLRSHAAFDLTQMDALAAKTKAFTTSFNTSAGATSAASATGIGVARAVFTDLPGYSSTGSNPSGQPNLRDLGSFFTAAAAKISNANAANTALATATINHTNGGQRTGQSGMNIGLPIASEMRGSSTYLADYAAKADAWSAASGWNDFQAKMLNISSTVPPAITGPGGVGSETITNSIGPSAVAKPTLHFSSTSPAAVLSEVTLAVQQGSGYVLQGLVARGLVTANTDYDFPWDGSVTALPGAGTATGAALTAHVAGGAVTSVTVGAGGSGWSGNPAVVFSGGGGTGAAGIATIAGGAITGITITNPGSGYAHAPTVTVAGTQTAYTEVFLAAGTTGTTKPIIAIRGTIALGSDAGAPTQEAKLLYQDGDASASLVALNDNGEPVVFSVTELEQIYPGSSFTPSVPGATTPGTTIPLAGTAVPVYHLPVAPGIYVLINTMTDVWGNQSTDLKAVSVTAPFFNG
jgi:hypothetical protein